MSIQESGEMYLETIYILSKRLQVIRSIDISEEMGYSKPSVSRAMGLLKDKGLITVEPSGNVLLTKTGEKTAKNIYERHTILTDVLVSLGVDKETAVQDACRIEHYISDRTFTAIKKHLKEHSV